MKILKRDQFLQLTPPVIYSKVDCGCILPSMYVAIEFFDNDWLFKNLNSTASQMTSENGGFSLDYEAIERDGSFDDETVEFLVYENADINSLVKTIAQYLL